MLATCLGVVVAAPALSQSTAPSSITPPTLRPPTTSADAAPVLPATSGLVPPRGSAGLTTRVGAVLVPGAFPAVAAETRAIADRLVGRTVTLADIYAAASAIEAAHIRHGYILARAVVPPQQIDAGGTITIRVIDGFIERVDTSALPTRLRKPVLRRTQRLVGRHEPTLAAIEQPLTIAGDVPGLSLTSTLSRGDSEGGTQLLLGGRWRPVTGGLSVDNSLAPSLGSVAVTGQASLNSVLGLGEQIYGFVVTGYDIPRAFRADAPVRVLGGGASLPIGDGRLSINPEATFSRTQPLPQPGVPRIRGTLRRLTIRGSYVIAKSRRRSLVAGVTVERIHEANDAIDFATPISLDDYTVARAQLSYASSLARGGGISLVAQISQGLNGRAGNIDVPVSRQDARPSFTHLNVTARALKPLTPRLALSLTARAQTPFGRALYRSEQSALEGADALSSYIGGVTAVDGSATLRGEIARAPLSAMHGIRLTPYVFGAVGEGWVSRPTAVEEKRYTLYDPGLGVRGAFAGSRIGASLEYGHGFSSVARFNGVDRVAAALTLVL